MLQSFQFNIYGVFIFFYLWSGLFLLLSDANTTISLVPSSRNFWKRFPLFHLIWILHKKKVFSEMFSSCLAICGNNKKMKKIWRPNKFVKVVVYFMTSPYIKITEQRVDLIKLFDQDFSLFCLCKLDHFIDVHFCSLWSKLMSLTPFHFWPEVVSTTS